MSLIHIRKKHTLGRTKARQTAEKMAKSLTSEYNAKCKWHKDDLQFTSKGVKGRLHVGQEEVDIKLELGMMLRPLKGKIERSIRAQLDDILDKGDSLA